MAASDDTSRKKSTGEPIGTAMNQAPSRRQGADDAGMEARGEGLWGEQPDRGTESTQVGGRPQFTGESTGVAEITNTTMRKTLAPEEDFLNQETRIGLVSGWPGANSSTTPPVGDPGEADTGTFTGMSFDAGRASTDELGGNAATRSDDSVTGTFPVMPFDADGDTGQLDANPFARRGLTPELEGGDFENQRTSVGHVPGDFSEHAANGADDTRIGTVADWSGVQAPPGGDNATLALAGATPGEGTPAGSPDLPSHLQLPNIDFSMPDLPGVVTGQNSVDITSNLTLPADLNLPEFPNLGVPSVEVALPGSEPTGPQLAQSASDPGHDTLPVPPPPPRRSSGGENVSTPPRRHAETASISSSPSTTFGIADDLSLPDLAPPPSKRKLTLLSMPAPTAADAPRRALWPYVIIAILAGAAVVGVTARERILAALMPHKPRPAVVAAPTTKETAKLTFAEGVRAYTAKDYPKAIERFDHALTLDATIAEAHRGLGIVYATLHEQTKAVEHYKKYIELSPQAPDAAEVHKIIDEYYAKAQSAKVAAEDEGEKERPAVKKTKLRRHGRR